MEKFTTEEEKGQKKEETPVKDDIITMETARHPEAPLTNPGYSPKENYEITRLQNKKSLLHNIENQLAKKENEIMVALGNDEVYGKKVARYNELLSEQTPKTDANMAELKALSDELKAKIMENDDIKDLLREQAIQRKGFESARRDFDDMYNPEL